MQAVREWGHDEYSYEHLLRELSRAKIDYAKKIVNTIFCETEHAQQLLKNPEPLFRCLKRFGCTAFLTDFLLRCCETSWFHDGLQLFAVFCEQNKSPSILSDALLDIHALLEKKQGIHELTVEKIMRALSTERAAQIILQYFVQDDPRQDVALASNKNSRTLMNFFTKNAVVGALKTLNQTQDWNNSSLYRLLIMTLYTHHASLFQAMEYRMGHHAWQADELKEAILFLRRYVNTPNQHDQKQIVMRHLLNELVYRAANAGLVGLLYNKNQSIEMNIAYFQVKQQAIIRPKSKVFSNPRELQALKTLQENQAIIDWTVVADEAFDLNQQESMPLFKAFLIHYTGTSAKIEKVLNDLLREKNTDKKALILSHIADVMSAMHHRDMGKVLFHWMENTVKEHPDLLNIKLLSHMAHALQQRYQKKPTKKQAIDERSILALIKYFGQKKQYALVEKACDLMIEQDSNNQRQPLFARIKKEAQVENALTPDLHCWYFSFVCFFKRLWHGTSKNPSSYVKPCDDASTYRYIQNPPLDITTHYASGQDIYKQVKLRNSLPQIRRMKERLDEMDFKGSDTIQIFNHGNKREQRSYFFQK